VAAARLRNVGGSLAAAHSATVAARWLRRWRQTMTMAAAMARWAAVRHDTKTMTILMGDDDDDDDKTIA
jgi:hypothetical protein